uniref:Ig-like domain-containing protein n=1 Tax=Labrus bergylta TaxID=56723 RepID=A0A3Q3GYW8_9LABR
MCPSLGELRLTGQPEPVVGLVGQQCVLSCRLQPAESVADKSVEWTRADLDPTYVLIYRQRRLEPKEVNPSFKERTELFEQGPEKGDMSLKLNYPKLSDTGTYTCKLVMDVSSQFSLEVPVGKLDFIGAVSEPQITLERSLDKLVFKCEVRNWYPKPEMEWRDSKEQIVPHEDISPVQDDEYFSIVSRITVEMWASDNYTCTVRQLGIRETRKTNFTVPGKSALVKFTMIIAESLSIALKGPMCRLHIFKSSCLIKISAKTVDSKDNVLPCSNTRHSRYEGSRANHSRFIFHIN